MAVTVWRCLLPQVLRARGAALGLRCGGWGSTLRCTGTQHMSDTAPTRCGTLLKERGGMTTSTAQFTEGRVKIAGTELYVLKGGNGPPVLVLHGVEGFEGRLRCMSLHIRAMGKRPVLNGWKPFHIRLCSITGSSRSRRSHPWTSSALVSAAGLPPRWQ